MHKVLKAIAILAWGAAPGLFAQTAELPFFWAYLRSPAQAESWVVADLRVHVLRDASGALDSGGSCVRLRYNLRDQMTLTAVRIHRPRGEDPGAVIRIHVAAAIQAHAPPYRACPERCRRALRRAMSCCVTCPRPQAWA